MKYHYKSPEEVRTAYKDKNKVHPFKNRTFLIIFADVILIVAVGLILEKTGLLGNLSSYKTDTFARGGMEFQGSMKNQFDSRGLLHLYLRVENNTEKTMEFPSEDGVLSVKEGILEIYKDGILYSREKLLISRKQAAPDEEFFYKFSLNRERLPGTEGISFIMILKTGSGDIRMEFPSGMKLN